MLEQVLVDEAADDVEAARSTLPVDVAASVALEAAPVAAGTITAPVAVAAPLVTTDAAKTAGVALALDMSTLPAKPTMALFPGRAAKVPRARFLCQAGRNNGSQ